MKSDIVDFIIGVCKEYKLEAIYFPDTDVYSIMKDGRAIQNFNREQFYSYPRDARRKEYRNLLAGLSHNLGESHKNQFFMRRKLGKRLYPPKSDM